VLSTTIGKIAAGIAGTTGTSSLGVSAFAVFRMTPGRVVPGGIWAALVVLSAATAVVSCLWLVLEYMLKKLEVEVRNKEAQLNQELKRTRLEIHRAVMEKAAGGPGSAASYRELIIADALYLAVEQNGSQPADLTHGHLYGRGVPGLLAGRAGPTTWPRGYVTVDHVPDTRKCQLPQKQPPSS